ncbi:MAG: hypothetical protein JSR26_10860 [Proteobacteria bacterium]|nr:hypothetical protein [Pseudomonadota bacterium]
MRVIDLAGLQQAISTGALGDGDVWMAGRSSDQLQDLQWDVGDLLECIARLAAADHKGAEWCEDGRGNWYLCDAYSIPYDDTRRCRDPRSFVAYYLKFSIDEDGSLQLIMLRNHLSR